MKTSTRLSPSDMTGWPVSASGLSRVALCNQDIEVRHYAPEVTDAQTPHDRDEMYFVISGNGVFERNGVDLPFEAGDALFAAAGEVHRFKAFSEDFSTWVLFYGSKKV